MDVTMTTSAHQWARFGNPLAADLGIHPCEDIVFSWSGLKLVLDLDTDSKSEHEKKIDAPQILDPILQYIRDLEECENEQNSFQEACIQRHDADASADPLVATHLNNGKDCTTQPRWVDECGAEADPKADLSDNPLPVTYESEEKSSQEQMAKLEKCGGEAEPQADKSKYPEVVTHQNQEKDCIKQVNQEEKLGAGDGRQINQSQVATQNHFRWHWGGPLPSEDDYSTIVEYCDEVEKNCVPKQAVTVSEDLAIVETSMNQEERKTSAFLYTDSSDDELGQETYEVSSRIDGNHSGLSPVTEPISSRVTTVTELIHSTDASVREAEFVHSSDEPMQFPEKETENSEDDPMPFPEEETANSEDELMPFPEEEIANSEDDVSAARDLLELANVSNCLLELANVSYYLYSTKKYRRRKRNSSNLSHHLKRLSELVESMYASLPPRSIKTSLPDVGFWTIKVSKDSGRLRMKRIKREKADFGLEIDGVDDVNEVIDKPPSKKHYKSWSALL